MDELDFSEFGVSAFDEVYFANRNAYWKMKQLVEKNRTDKRIVGTGDALQSKPIQELLTFRVIILMLMKSLMRLLKTKLILTYAKG